MINFKIILSEILVFIISSKLIPCILAVVDVAESPDTIFATSNDDGTITINANIFCANGNISTNGMIVSSGNMNVNGNKTKNANDDILINDVSILPKISKQS